MTTQNQGNNADGIAAMEDIFSHDYALEQDRADQLAHLRSEFIIPSKADLKSSTTAKISERENPAELEPCTYLCGNSLGLQPACTREYILKYLDTWATKGVNGHFTEFSDAVSSPWLSIDEDTKEGMAKVLGALPSEVEVMQTLTANLHLLMASFYKPTKERYKIIIEGKAFPSDHYAVLSQLAHHGFPSSGLVIITPPKEDHPYLPTEHICAIIKEHASSTALILLPGVQYYTGQLFDIDTITKFAHELGLTIGWDLAHAAGNAPLSLHDWNVDFAAWCSYKYLNAGPGSIGGLFVHERHGNVDKTDSSSLLYRPRLSGWWGHDKATRFIMGPNYVPTPGASGFQISNPSVFDSTAVIASLSLFNKTSMTALREKSLRLTGYLEKLLLEGKRLKGWPYKIITPSNPNERGAQLSIRLEPGLLDTALKFLDNEGVIVDERKPDVMRVAPAPLYNNFEDVFRFYQVFEKALSAAIYNREGSVKES